MLSQTSRRNHLIPKSICDDISEENVEKIFANFDSTGDKSVDFEEFKVSSMRIYNDADNE